MFGGSAASLAVLGDPDIALITLSDLAEQMRRMARAGSLPVLVDADHGYGNALNVRRTVQELEMAGAAGLTIEDTLLPQAYGEAQPQLISHDEGIGKIRVEGLETGDWVLIDCGDIIVHVFRPEIREFYSLEKMWAAPDLDEETRAFFRAERFGRKQAMRISLFAVGRLKSGPERELAERYLDRFAKAGPAIGLELGRVTEIAESRASNAETRKREEAGPLEKLLADGAPLILLDERGKALDSPAFAELVGGLRDAGKRDLVIAIGGPDGLDPRLTGQAAHMLSFGKLTWPHQMVRVMLAEQLYRATDRRGNALPWPQISVFSRPNRIEPLPIVARDTAAVIEGRRHKAGLAMACLLGSLLASASPISTRA
eukprot:gene38538-52059_t